MVINRSAGRLLKNRWNFQWTSVSMPRTQHSSTTASSSLTPLLWPSDVSNCLQNTHPSNLTPPLHNFPPCPRPEQGQDDGRWTLWESGLGWDPLTNTQPNVLIDPMPSYFRTSARRQGAARRDQQSASLKELEQERRRSGWREGAAEGSQHSSKEVNKKAGGHKFNCATQNDGIRNGGVETYEWMK